MIKQTEILKIEIEEDSAWIGEKWKMPNSSKGYHGLLKTWFDHFGLKGKGILIGEMNSELSEIFKKRYPECVVQTSDIAENPEEGLYPDIHWNICNRKQTKDLKLKVDFIICHAVLEHVVDPYGAIYNMMSTLKRGGRLYIHTHSPKFQEHRFPVDCYRFLRDVWFEIAKSLDIKIDDLLWLDRHCFVVYNKTHNDF